jgi:membrane-associated phospholipid phosphatase
VRTVDKLIAGYVAFVTLVILIRGSLLDPANWLLLGIHALIAVLLLLFTLLGSSDRVGQMLHDLYPLILLPVLYSELGMMNVRLGVVETFNRDALVQSWEAALFGGQISYDWIRSSPSVFWSGLLHLAYLCYYPIILIGPVGLTALGRRTAAQRVLLATMIAFVACYVVFTLFPVAGPNYAFEHPVGAVREVWSAHLVYLLLGSGSAFGTAFPSSHVAAAVAATVALWYVHRPLSLAVLLPTALLIISTVYCQMHYAIDAATGFALGVTAGWSGPRLTD